jgi:hypothetical protein
MIEFFAYCLFVLYSIDYGFIITKNSINYCLIKLEGII